MRVTEAGKDKLVMITENHMIDHKKLEGVNYQQRPFPNDANARK